MFLILSALFMLIAAGNDNGNGNNGNGNNGNGNNGNGNNGNGNNGNGNNGNGNNGNGNNGNGNGNRRSAYRRQVQHAKDISPPTNDIANIQDPGQNRVVGFDGGTVVTRQEADQLTNQAMDFFLSWYGYNFRTAPYNPTTGQWILADRPVVMFTFLNGADFRYRAILDTDNDDVWKKNNRFVLDFGYLVIAQAAGTFPGGVMVGQPYSAGSILAYTKYIYLEEEDRGKPIRNKVKERILIKSEVPGIQFRNDQGFTEQLIKGVIVDEKGRAGFNAVLVTITKDQLTGQIHQRLRSSLTWNHTM